MAETIYATFPDASLAEKAIGALLDYGVQASDISLVSRNVPVDQRRDEAAHGATVAERHTWTDRRADRTAEAGDQTAADAAGAVGARGTAANYQAAADQRAAQADANAPADRDDTDRRWGGRVDDDRDDVETAGKSGISTTTPADAGVGAAKGAGIGLGVGILAAIASLVVPGFGLVVGGGALATAIAGAVGTTVAGAVAGGVYGYLKDQGMPDEVAANYQRAYEQGAAILAVRVPSGDVDRATAEGVIGKYGARDVSTFGAAAA